MKIMISSIYDSKLLNIQIYDIPVTTNGKLDRKVLPEPNLKELVKGNFIVPKTAIEKYTSKIYNKILLIILLFKQLTSFIEKEKLNVEENEHQVQFIKHYNRDSKEYTPSRIVFTNRTNFNIENLLGIVASAFLMLIKIKKETNLIDLIKEYTNIMFDIFNINYDFVFSKIIEDFNMSLLNFILFLKTYLSIYAFIYMRME
ncbi:hypothetical protein BCR32DRAFT_251622 [Anaeromyces robustus]|uniref:AMP-binding enzyme C-terminal domain-containing protein n=1 Tax=Anaeromyces robustus TaxID=1754192 RepID=A0A1Y1VQP1_9FUNG|nr:hypothetical protein BCR32DRAFT_251622 [Anaeromyces robustus]|eukprot:ORX63356.1 hypothetical protein BCR32DRAFT_251622 [Anaeromyces robustus]